jgi:uroporphyrinogen decarboxylase
MVKMTSHERFKRMFEHKEADRVAMWDFPWPGTLRRWHREGMPENTSCEDYFDVDKVSRVVVDNSPLYPEYIVEENDNFKTVMTKWDASSGTSSMRTLHLILLATRLLTRKAGWKPKLG